MTPHISLAQTFITGDRTESQNQPWFIICDSRPDVWGAPQTCSVLISHLSGILNGFASNHHKWDIKWNKWFTPRKDKIKLIGELIPNMIVSLKLIVFLDQIYYKLPHLERLHFQIMYFLNEMWKISQLDSNFESYFNLLNDSSRCSTIVLLLIFLKVKCKLYSVSIMFAGCI